MTQAPALRVGALLSETCEAVKAHPLSLLLPFVILGLVGGGGHGQSIYAYRYQSGTPPLDLIPFYAFLGVVGLVVVVLLFLAYVAATLMTTRAALVALREGRDLDFGEQLHETQALFVPSIGTLLIWLVAVVVGFILVILPGVFLVTAFLVWPAVVVAESRSGTDALRRAWDMTRGHRWPLLGAWLVLAVAAAVGSALVGWLPLVGGALAGIVNGAFLAAGVVLAVAAYDHLRLDRPHQTGVVQSGPFQAP